jgi:hypothetical protein
MLGTYRWNITIGFVGMVLTVLFSIGGNLLLTTLLRGFYCFIVLFILGFPLRWFLGTIIGIKDMDMIVDGESGTDNQVKGNHIDYSTPNDEDEMRISQPGEESASSKEQPFSPLTPPKLASKDNLDPEELVKAIRHMSED